MAKENDSEKTGASQLPVPDFERNRSFGRSADYAVPQISALPQVLWRAAIFSIARDPRTLFTIGALTVGVFAKGEPIDRQVYLRVKNAAERRIRIGGRTHDGNHYASWRSRAGHIRLRSAIMMR